MDIQILKKYLLICQYVCTFVCQYVCSFMFSTLTYWVKTEAIHVSVIDGGSGRGGGGGGGDGGSHASLRI